VGRDLFPDLPREPRRRLGRRWEAGGLAVGVGPGLVLGPGWLHVGRGAEQVPQLQPQLLDGLRGGAAPARLAGGVAGGQHGPVAAGRDAQVPALALVAGAAGLVLARADLPRVAAPLPEPGEDQVDGLAGPCVSGPSPPPVAPGVRGTYTIHRRSSCREAL